MLDIHSHILPGVDDGSPNFESSLNMLDAAKIAGVSAIIATPHVENDFSWKKAEEAYQYLRPEADARNIRIFLGCEVHYSRLIAILDDDLWKYTFRDAPVLLLHLPSHHLMPNWDAIFSKIRQNGIIPVIAHPERYLYIQKTPDMIYDFIRYGCAVQVDAQAILGRFWDPETKCIKSLLKMDAVDTIASDAHCAKDYVSFKKSVARLKPALPPGIPVLQRLTLE